MAKVVLISFTLPHEAHLAKGYLESEGIEVLLKDELTTQAHNLWSNAIGGVKLLVNEEDVNHGIELLKKGKFILANKDSSLDSIDVIKINNEIDSNKCPYCQSKNIAVKPIVRAWTYYLILIFGVLIPLTKDNNTCFDCDREWRFVK